MVAGRMSWSWNFVCDKSCALSRISLERHERTSIMAYRHLGRRLWNHFVQLRLLWHLLYRAGPLRLKHRKSDRPALATHSGFAGPPFRTATMFFSAWWKTETGSTRTAARW